MAGGVIIVWWPGRATVDVFQKCTQQVCIVISKMNGPTWLLSDVYASTDYRECRALWNEIFTLLVQGIPTPVA